MPFLQQPFLCLQWGKQGGAWGRPLMACIVAGLDSFQPAPKGDIRPAPENDMPSSENFMFRIAERMFIDAERIFRDVEHTFSDVKHKLYGKKISFVSLCRYFSQGIKFSSYALEKFPPPPQKKNRKKNGCF